MIHEIEICVVVTLEGYNSERRTYDKAHKFLVSRGWIEFWASNYAMMRAKYKKSFCSQESANREADNIKQVLDMVSNFKEREDD